MTRYGVLDLPFSWFAVREMENLDNVDWEVIKGRREKAGDTWLVTLP